VSDLQLRRMERRAQAGDHQAAAHQLILRIRVGEVPREHVTWAAHQGDPVAKLVEEHPQVLIDCGYCRRRRTRWEQDTRRYKEPLPYCNRCNNTTRTTLERGLIRFAKQTEGVPIRLLVAWACDCAERGIDRLSSKNPNAFEGRYRLPNQPLRDPTFQNVIASARHWLHTGIVDQLIFQNADANPIARAVAQSEMEGAGKRLRSGLAEIVSEAWDCSRVERTWQEGRLIQYLLGYCE
jgi:hypothetical protein